MTGSLEAQTMKKILLSFLFGAALVASSCAFAENAVDGEKNENQRF